MKFFWFNVRVVKRKNRLKICLFSASQTVAGVGRGRGVPGSLESTSGIVRTRPQGLENKKGLGKKEEAQKM